MRKKILLHCADTVDSSMAGPAIRYWEFASALSDTYEVTLLTPNTPKIHSDKFKIAPLSQTSIHQEISQADVLITQLMTPAMAFSALWYGVNIIIDAYDPIPLEYLEIFKAAPPIIKNYRNKQIKNGFSLSFQMADALICANDQQRDLWMGKLMSLGCLTSQKYAFNPNLRHYIDIVPFGLPAMSPQKNGEGLRKKFNLNETDPVLLWGGGIWNWFDPLTLIKAVKKLAEQDLPIRLVFMGLKHPNPNVPEMKMAVDAAQLAKDLKIYGTHVFFNYGWIPYEERQNFLLEATIGVSIHSEHLETRYAFRTRILDYIWAQLPILATEGDSFADVIKENHLGIVVPYNDVDVVAKAIQHLAFSDELRRECKQNLANLSHHYHWKKLVRPIEGMIERLTSSPKKGMTLHNVKRLFISLYKMRGPGAILHKFFTLLFDK